MTDVSIRRADLMMVLAMRIADFAGLAEQTRRDACHSRGARRLRASSFLFFEWLRDVGRGWHRGNGPRTVQHQPRRAARI